MKKLYIFILLTLCSVLASEDLNTLDGKTYKDVSFGRYNKRFSRIMVWHRTGAAQIDIGKLPDAYLKKIINEHDIDIDLKLETYDDNNGKCGFLRNGRVFIKAQFDGCGMDWNNRLMLVGNNGKEGFINQSGKYVVPPIYDPGTRPFAEGLANVYKNGKMGYIDRKGRVRIPIKFNEGTSFHNGTAIVNLNGKCGYINKRGVFIIQPVFDELERFRKGVAKARVGNKWGFINKNGKFIIKPDFENIKEFSAGLAPVKSNGKWGYIDHKGHFVIKPQFDDVIFPFIIKKGKFAVVAKGKQMRIIDRTGKTIKTLPDTCKPVQLFQELEKLPE